MAFFPLKGFPDDAADFEVRVISLSSTVTIGDALIPGATGHNKSVKGGANTTGVLVGVLVAILNATYGPTELNSVTTSSTNESTPVYYAQFIPLTTPGQKFRATLSAAAGTTTDSGGMGSFNLSSTLSGTLDETSIALFSATEKQFFSWGVDPTDPSNLTVIGSFAKTLTP